MQREIAQTTGNIIKDQKQD